MAQPKTLTNAQLQQYRDLINNGGVNAVRQVYAELYADGYGYAGWANGVATGNSITHAPASAHPLPDGDSSVIS
jgi:hypothetical protein